jgi:HMG-box domain
MAEYQPPDKQANRKRNKTGYNMFFSAHVLRLKQTESGVPSERGSVARLVGTAWKLLPQEEKAYYEREADKHNGMNPVRDGDDEEDEDEIKRQQREYHMHAAAAAHHEMHGGMPPPPMHGGMPHHDARQPPPHHHGYYAPPPPPPHMYGPPPPAHPPPPYGHYDYSQHQRHHQARAQGYQQAYPPPPQRHYDA